MNKNIPNELAKNLGDINIRKEVFERYGSEEGQYNGINENQDHIELNFYPKNGFVLTVFAKHHVLESTFYDTNGEQQHETVLGEWR